jgi:hypothetical protein
MVAETAGRQGLSASRRSNICRNGRRRIQSLHRRSHGDGVAKSSSTISRVYRSLYPLTVATPFATYFCLCERVRWSALERADRPSNESQKRTAQYRYGQPGKPVTHCEIDRGIMGHRYLCNECGEWGGIASHIRRNTAAVVAYRQIAVLRGTGR